MQFGISESIEHWAKYKKNNIAIFSNGIEISYERFNILINSLISKINKINLNATRVGLAIKSKQELIVAMIAIVRTRKSVVLLNVNLSDDSLKSNIKDTVIELLIYDNNYTNINKICSDRNIQSININKINCIYSSDTTIDPYSCKPDDEWGVLFSSGTTGTPKGIERDHNSIVTELLGWCLELNLSKQAVFYIGRPIYYTGGLVLALSTFIAGGSIVINDYRDENDFLLILEDYIKALKINTIEWAFFVPDQIRVFCDYIKTNSVVISNKSKNIITMGAPITGNEKIEANKLLKSNIIESWGNTESLGTITEAEDLFIRPDSIGRPFITDELYILGEELEKLPSNSIGRIAGNEEAGFSKYSNRPTETERIKQREFIISDDWGYIDKDGFYYIKGRTQDKIISKGKTYFTSEIEEEIKNIDSVNNCCILFKATHNYNGLCVALIIKENHKQTKVIKKIKNILRKHDLSTNTIKIIGEFPRLTSGKIDKIKLTELFNE